MAFLSAFLKFKKTIILLVLLLASGLVYAFYPTKNDYQTISVVMGNVNEEVRLTGKIVSTNDVNLGFEIAGRIAGTPKDVGNKVSVGETIAFLDTTDTQLQLQEAEADLAVSEANLAEVKKGKRVERLLSFLSQHL